MLDALRGAGEGGERELRVGHDAELGGEVAADLRDVRVDVDQTRRRDVEREPRIPRARVRFREARADREDEIRGPALLVRDRRAPETGHAEQQRMILAHDALAHERVGDRQLERLGQRHELRRRARRQDAAAGVEHGPLGVREGGDDPLGGRLVNRRARDLGGDLVEGVDREGRREHVHRHVDEHRARPAGLRQVERALHDPRQVPRVVDAVDPLAERPVDLALVRVLVEVDLLVRMASVEVRLDVAGDDDHRDRVERGVGDAGRRVRQAGPQVREQDAGLA